MRTHKNINSEIPEQKSQAPLSPASTPRNNFIAGSAKSALLFLFLVVLDVACGYILLFLLDFKNRK